MAAKNCNRARVSMHLNHDRRRHAKAGMVLFWVAASLFFGTVGALRSDNFVIYQPTSRSLVAVQAIDGVKYLPLLQVLNAVGKVEAIQEKRETLKVRFENTELELQLNDGRIRMGRDELDLPHPVRRPGSQWLVPVEFLATVLPTLTRQVIEYKPGASRVFVGDVKPLSFSVRLDPAPNGARLTVHFSEKVDVRSTATDGKWYLYLGDRPVQPIEQTYRFQNPYVSEVVFDDQNGTPKLVISPATPGLNFYPATADGGKSFLADVLRPPPPVAPTPSGPEEPPSVATAPSPGVPEMTIPEPEVRGVPGPPLPVVVLDAAHGGEDTGARGRDGVLEKDLTAQLAARVRLALLAAGKYRVQLTRLGEVNPSFDQREIVANTTKPAAFLSFHAGSLGNLTPRVAVFSYRSAPRDPSAPPPLLIPWEEIHRAHAGRSRLLAEILQARFAQVPGLTADPPRQAPVRSLRSIDAPAVAIEIGSLNPSRDTGPLTQVGFQQQLAAAIAAGLEAFWPEAP